LAQMAPQSLVVPRDYLIKCQFYKRVKNIS
jgi:hypothetical protein